MININLDLSKIAGSIKPMNAVNNGPIAKSVRGIDNFDDYKALEIPYARNHDASFCYNYGGEHTVDVHRIFKNFEADENDPASYIFGPTDTYIANTEAAGTRTFYRLGASIEHGYKYGTYPPADYEKWARICEHIIMHYTEGWADGFFYDITYWEIWNEPDCPGNNGMPNWQGTEDEFIDLYCVSSKHLKKCFPHLKIGGPAFYSGWRTPFRIKFLEEVKKRNAPLDFYSFHGYLKTPDTVMNLSCRVVEYLTECGFSDVELIFNEWNYMTAWSGDDFKYSINTIKGLKGSSFVTGVMCVGQASDLDMLMYYDFTPCDYNGAFGAFYCKLKTYYSFAFFRELRRLGNWIPTEYKTESIYTCAATNGTDSALLLTHFTENDDQPAAEIKIDFHNLACKNGVKVSYYLIDNDHDGELVREELFTVADASVYLKMPLFGTYLIKITAL